MEDPPLSILNAKCFITVLPKILEKCRKIATFIYHNWIIYNMDNKDLEILDELMKDSRRSVKDIAKNVGLPRSTVHNRIQKMIETKVIKKFTVIPDYKKIGKEITAFTLINYRLGEKFSLKELEQKIAAIPEVSEAHTLSGNWDMLIKTRVSNIEDIHKLVNDRISCMKSVDRISTHFSLGTIKEENE
jgi:DNA-binding Lrp family transcriptional regulator